MISSPKIVNIRGTSGSGKSTLVQRFLKDHPSEPIYGTLGDWKKPKIIAYKLQKVQAAKVFVSYTGFVRTELLAPTYVIGRYETQCGGCDSLSYKGSFEDIQAMVEEYAELGNVIFEGLTVSSTYGRFLKVSQKFPGQMIWAFMNTPLEVCHQRILSRNGGKEPKRDAKGSADYERKYSGCITQARKLTEMGERVIELDSGDAGYAKLLEVLS